MRRVQRQRRNLTLMDYCTDEPAVRQRRLRRRLAARGHASSTARSSSSTSATASSAAGRTACGTRSSPASAARRRSRFPRRRRRYTTLATTPVSREKPTSTSTPPAPTASSCRPRGPTPPARRWAERPHPGPVDPAVAVLRRQARRLGQRRSTRRWPAARTCCSPPASTTSTRASRSSGPTRSCSGLGMATLTAQRRRRRSTVGDVQGVDVAGLIVDAGTVNSPVLLRIGREGRQRRGGTGGDPTALQDVFFRIGGPHVGKATLEPRGQQRRHDPRRHLGLARRPRRAGPSAGPSTPPTPASSSTATTSPPPGLFVEHYQKYNVDLERRERQDGLLPERAALRRAEPGGLAARRRPRATPPTRSPTTSDATSCGAWAATSSPTSTRRSTRATPSRCRSRRACRCTTCSPCQLSRPARSTTSSTAPAARSHPRTPGPAPW